MRMMIAVTDACIFIDLFDLDLIAEFFDLGFDVHTTVAVIYELYQEQQSVLLKYKTQEKLTIHNLIESDYLEISQLGFPKSLSETDKSVLYVANKLNACVLSSDKTMRNYARNNHIAYHGILWIFDQLVEDEILSKPIDVRRLQTLLATNFVFRNNLRLMQEVDKRIGHWI